jgi:hypothetical protein
MDTTEKWQRTVIRQNALLSERSFEQESPLLLRERLSMKLVKPLFKNVFTPPDESSDERCWPGGSFHRKVYGHATSQK